MMISRIYVRCDPIKIQSYDLCDPTTRSSYCTDILVVELGIC